MSGYINKSKSDDYETPYKVIYNLREEFGYMFDPCPLKCDLDIWDGLKNEWKEVNFVNPPYSDLKSWIKKAHEEWQKGKTIVMLIPSRTDTIAFHKYIYGQAELRFIKGRLKFRYNDEEMAACPFASMLVIFRGELK